MKHFPDFLLILGVTLLTCCGGGNGNNNGASTQPEEPAPAVQSEEPEVQDFYFDLDADGLPVKRVLAPAKDREKCFIVISKVHPEHLNVYEVQAADTVLLASYPVCIAKNRGQKQVRGDNKTPESYPGPPFSISQIQDASDWHHDFGDGRGSIPAYGHWFMRLVTPGHSGIGIHGSTNNRESLKVGRGSEGCIRLLDEDIIHLRDNYAFVGMKVTILPEDHGPLPFEQVALRHLFREQPQQIERPADLPEQSVVLPEKEDEPQAETAPQAEQEIARALPDRVKVKGTRQRLRLGPDPQYELFENENGQAICPDEGEILPCLGEEGNYYKVIFKDKTLYINKKSVEIPQ